jgi:DNA topoisomerase-1
MMLAQRLYENGHITYMRTDSVNLSDLAINDAKSAIVRLYGAEYAETRKYSTKSKGAQEAHEAIRPTDLNVQDPGVEDDQKRLYDLIWKRTIACQMADARLEKTAVDISISSVSDRVLQAKGEVITFEGFLKVYQEGKDEEPDEIQ